MAEISYGAYLPVAPERAFAFVTTPANLPLFFESMSAARALDGWGSPGGRAQVVIRFLGRDVTSDWELVEWDEPHGFRYLGRQAGRPDLDNRRTFVAEGPGTRFTGTSTMTPRRGLAGVVDRVSLRVLKRVFDRAMTRLPDVVATR